MAGTLYLAATPIGNLSDISERAIQTLNAVDFIAAEDTRVTVKLLNHLGIKKPMVSYYKHNRRESGERIIERLESGESCALVSDAGTPAISDPGEDLVRLCAECGVDVIPIPGPCAAVAALSVSGLPTGRFCFEGFLSTGKKSRFEHLEQLKDERRTMVFYEAPHKLMTTLTDMLGAFGDREVSIAREITKLHEEVLRTTLTGAIAHFESKPPKGEFALVIKGAEESVHAEMSDADALALIRGYRESGLSLSEAAKLAANQSGRPKSELYSLALKDDNDDEA